MRNQTIKSAVIVLAIVASIATVSALTGNAEREHDAQSNAETVAVLDAGKNPLTRS